MGTLNNFLTGSLTNNGALNNSGTIVNFFGGTLINNSVLDNNSGGTLNNGDGSALNNAGALNNADTLNNDGAISNSGTFIVSPSGIVTGIGSFTQTGGETQIDGLMTQGLIDIQGGRLHGNGTIASTGDFLIGPNAILAPGNSTGMLVLDGGPNGIDFSGDIEIEILDALTYDVLKILGDIRFGVGTDFIFKFLYTPNVGDVFHFFDSDFAGGLSNVRFTTQGIGASYRFAALDAGNGNLDFLTLAGSTAPSGVPEPESLLVLLSGLSIMGAMGATRRRRN